MIRTPYAFFHVVFVQFAPLKKKNIHRKLKWDQRYPDFKRNNLTFNIGLICLRNGYFLLKEQL